MLHGHRMSSTPTSTQLNIYNAALSLLLCKPTEYFVATENEVSVAAKIMFIHNIQT
jgi:hypothetical protein